MSEVASKSAGSEFSAENKDNAADDRSVNAKQSDRDKIESDIEAFLNTGGSIQHISPHVTADPPKKPTNNYGGRAI